MWERNSFINLGRGPFTSQLDYMSRLQFNSPPFKFPLSGIVCTIGPASNKTECMVNLIKAGMRVIRLNFSHGSHEDHCQSLQAARQAVAYCSNEMGVHKSVAIALDTKGPEIRTGKIASGESDEIELKQGNTVILSTEKNLENNCTKDLIYVDFKNISKILKPGNHVFIDDGLISLLVKKINANMITCEVENGGKLGSQKGVNLPGVPVDLPAVSEKDIGDLRFAVEQNLDFIFASFIRNAAAVNEIRQILGTKGSHIKIISKIENQQGMLHIDEIIDASDGIMIARGDLGIEIHTDEVIIAQKAIIAKCNKIGKPVICATQMLESMTNKPRPTRAEASDVANAIFDGADCVMLSAETAKGKYPIESVECMARICAKVESVLWYESIQNDVKNFIKTQSKDQISAVSLAIAEAALLGDAKAILIASQCALIPQLVSQFRANCPIIMLTGSAVQARQSVIYRGIYPLVSRKMKHGSKNFKKILKSGVEQLSKLNMLKIEKNTSIVIVDALKADRISFRLLSMKQKNESENLLNEKDEKMEYRSQNLTNSKIMEKNEGNGKKKQKQVANKDTKNAENSATTENDVIQLDDKKRIEQISKCIKSKLKQKENVFDD